jgi:lactose/L-arabinose transport system ATP-binding protein
MSTVTLKGVVKEYGSIRILHGIDLDIKQNEFVVFVGPSGCGKSTLLRSIAGLEDITGGQIHIGGKDVTDLEPVDRGISMVFQSYALYPHMTVEENMSFGLKVAKVPDAEIKSRVAEAAKSLQLEKYLSRKPSQLSGGQRQRVAIGRSIVRKPEVFLFDEPLSNLDAELRVHMRIEIARLHKRLGATMIYVTHDQVEAMTLADKIVVLQGGKVEQVGSPLELYDNPDNRFVAGFIGSPKMNFLDATVLSSDGPQVKVGIEGDTTRPLSLNLQTRNLTAGSKLTIGARPEHIDFSGASGVGLPVRCDVTEEMGEVTFIHAYTGAGTHVVVETRGKRFAEPPTDTVIGIDPAKVLVFAENGARIR